MANDIQIFKNEKFGEVRVAINKQGEPMFCLADVCKASSTLKGCIRRNSIEIQSLAQRLLHIAEKGGAQ